MFSDFLGLFELLSWLQVGLKGAVLFWWVTILFPFDPGGGLGCSKVMSVLRKACLGCCYSVPIAWWLGVDSECCRRLVMLVFISVQHLCSSSFAQLDRCFLNWPQDWHVVQEMRGRCFGFKNLTFSCCNARFLDVIVSSDLLKIRKCPVD